jgi:REP element-mobilizing transposase RayT
VPRIRRSDLPDGVFHVTTRGVFRRLVFVDDHDRLLFLRLLGLVVWRYRWDCHAFCLMGTHYHLVLETTTERLSAGMQYLNGVYAQRFNRRHDRDGHVFGARFASWVVRDDDHYERTIEYVLTNPVRAGLVDDWTEWRWSGARGVRSTAQLVLDAERTRRERPAARDLLDLRDPRTGDEARQPRRIDHEVRQVARRRQPGPDADRAAGVAEDRRAVPAERVGLPGQSDACTWSPARPATCAAAVPTDGADLPAPPAGSASTRPEGEQDKAKAIHRSLLMDLRPIKAMSGQAGSETLSEHTFGG